MNKVIKQSKNSVESASMVQWFNGSMVQWGRTILMFLVILSTFSNIEVNAQYVKNGSFEEHREGQYPIGMSGSDEYSYSEFLKCLNLAPNLQTPYEFPPTPFMLNNGWYMPTNNASSDYYHKNGVQFFKLLNYEEQEYQEQNPKIPTVKFWFEMGYDTLYAITSGAAGEFDSAYAGIGIIIKKKENNEIGLTYKEYIQSKLNTTLISGIYHVSFQVIRSKYSPALRSICALFSSSPIINPSVYNGQDWETNLAYNSTTNDKIEYINIEKTQHNAICSDDFILNSTEGGSIGNNDWQTISGFLIVPEDSVYNYITIGNFQKDANITYDYAKNPIEDFYRDNRFYYYIDNIKVIPAIQCTQYPCHCPKDLFKFDITKDLQNSDSTQCCYSVNYTITDSEVFNGTCPISMIQLKKNSDVILSLTPPDGLSYTEGTYTANFCLDNFSSSENNVFTLLYYTKDQNGQDTVLYNCVRNIDIKCICECSDLNSYPYKITNPEISFKKTGSDSSGKCCWDLMINYPDSTSGSTCNFNLSNKYIELINNVPYCLSEATFNSDYLELVSWPSNRRIFQFPDNFIIKPGDKKSILKLCFNPLPNDQQNIITINLLDFFDSSTESHLCDSLITQNLRCDTTESCCDIFKLITEWPEDWDYQFNYCDFEFLNLGTCCIPLILEVVNTPSNCNLNDTFVVSAIYSNPLLNQSMVYTRYFTPAELNFGKNLIDFIPLTTSESEYICINITNISTNETCTVCDSAICHGFWDTNNESEIMFYKNSDKIESGLIINTISYDNVLEIEFENDIILDNSKVVITDLIGRVYYNQSYSFKKGINTINFETSLPKGNFYFISISNENYSIIHKFILY